MQRLKSYSHLARLQLPVLFTVGLQELNVGYVKLPLKSATNPG